MGCVQWEADVKRGHIHKRQTYTFICLLFVTRSSLTRSSLSVVGFDLRMGREERGSYVLSP